MPKSPVEEFFCSTTLMDLNLMMNLNISFNFEFSPLCKDLATIGFPALGSNVPDDPCIWSLLFKRCSMFTPLEKENNRLYQRKYHLGKIIICVLRFCLFNLNYLSVTLRNHQEIVLMIIKSLKFRVVIGYLLTFKH